MKSWRAFSPHSMMRRHAVDVLDHRVMIASIPRNPYYSLIFALLVNGDSGFSLSVRCDACDVRCDAISCDNVYISIFFVRYWISITYDTDYDESHRMIFNLILYSVQQYSRCRAQQQPTESSTAYTFIQQYSSTDAERSSNQQSHLLSVCIAL